MKKLIIAMIISLNLFAAPRVGDMAVDFTLPELYAPQQSLSSNSLKGKVVLLNLWASWCSGCQEEMPLFVSLQKQYNNKDFVIVTASIDNIPQSAKDFLNRVDADKQLTSVYDANKVLPKSYRCPGMPSSFLIGKDGKIAAVFIGSLDKDAINDLKNKIDKLAGK